MRSRWIRAVAIGTMAGFGLAGSASAQDRPYVSSGPTTSGSAIVGSTLTSTGGQAGGPNGTKVGRAWLRCDNATDERTCDLINGAWDTSTYALRRDDLGKYMRSALYAYRDQYLRDLVWKMSPATAAVTNPAPPPAPTPVPTPAPPVVEPAVPVPPLTTEQAPPPAAAAPQTTAKRMSPFPTVRISGVVFANGAQISRLTVRAPRGARITISCFGKGCPNRRVKRVARGKSIHVPAYEKYLRSGVRLVITISRKGYVSKVTTIRIRKKKAPLRSDLCRVPGATTTSNC
ncbi:hypothetical protein OJ998_11550 [Solirubrobacter taibaiensis]|nr:hypothetical protein [Solirubrobacter taibaiensis]